MTRRLRCVFRIAAGPRLGFGHLMRARALARALGVRPVVSVRGGAAARRTARSLGCSPAGDGPAALDRAHVLVVDDPSAAHRDEWLRRASRRGVCAIAVLDVQTSQKNADLVVNGSVSGVPVATGRLLAGARFYLLDGRLIHTRRQARGTRSPRVLIALGGGAHVLRAAKRLVRAVRHRCPDAAIHVAGGFAGGRRAALDGGRWLARRDGLAGPLSAADVAVLAGGVTLYEACALGVPAVCLAVAPAQRRAIRRFAASGAVADGGGPRLDHAALDRVATAVARLLNDAAARRRSSRVARRLVDGRGAARVAHRIQRLVAARGGATRG